MNYKAKFGFQGGVHPCDSADLLAFEATLVSGRLPQDYREFLLEWNGGTFDPAQTIAFPLQDADDEFDCGTVSHLLGLVKTVGAVDLRKGSAAYGFRESVPPSYIVIGHECGLEQLCLSTAGEDEGAVFWWTPGEPWGKVPEPTIEFLRPVAANFREFWRVLFCDE